MSLYAASGNVWHAFRAGGNLSQIHPRVTNGIQLRCALKLVGCYVVEEFGPVLEGALAEAISVRDYAVRADRYLGRLGIDLQRIEHSFFCGSSDPRQTFTFSVGFQCL